MKQIGILIVSLIIALAGCTTTTENEFIQDIPTSAIIDSRLEISLEDGVVVSIWPTEDGPLRVYAAVGTAPQPDNRSLQLPMQEYLLNTVGSSTVDITTSEELPLQLADHFSRSPGFDFEIDVDTVSYLLGPYAVTPFTGGVIYTLHGDPFLIQRFHNNDGGITKQSIVLDEQLWHGLGGVTSTLDLSASRATIRQRAEYGDQTYLHIPFFFSSGGSSLYYNAATDDTVRFGPRGSGSMTYTSRTPYLDGLIWSTPSPKHSVSSFYELSGSSSLLPRWAFGYIQSKYGYRTQEEVYEVVERFIDEGIPLSSIVLDLYWFEHMGDFTWDTAAFPEPDELTEFLDEQDIRLLTITEPYMTVDSVEYERFKQAGLLVQNNDGEVSTWSSWWTFDSPAGSMIDMAADGTQEILGSHYVEMMRKGIDSFWTDLGEPEEVPPNARFGPYPARDYHNYYNREWSRIISEEVEEAFPDRRFWILSRSGFTGSAGYNVSIWSGDVRSDFEALSRQTAHGLGSGVTGFSYWGSDVGGFESRQEIPERELFIRWMQFGSYSPIFRPHGAMSSREPWIHDSEATRIIRSTVLRRSMLIPYIYSTAFQTYTEGLPIMRPPYFSAPEQGWNDSNSAWMYTDASSYWFGDFLYVHPITAAQDEEPETFVRLPPGEWYDFSSLRRISGTSDHRAFNLNEYPVYIRAGGIIPMDRQFNGEVDTLIVIPDITPTSFTWYEDDGTTNNYKNGEYESIEITLSDQGIRFSGVKIPRSITLVAPSDRAPEGFIRMGASSQRQIRIPRGDSVFAW